MEAMISHRKNTAFTLLEVLLSVAIFLLLAGGIFAAVSVTMKAANEITLTRLESERIDAFQRFVRVLFSNLPGRARAELRVRQWEGKGSVVELLLAPAPEFADFSRNAAETGGIALSAVPDGSGFFTLSLKNFGSELSPEDRDRQLRGPGWIALLPGVQEIRWRFASSNMPGLQETWDANNGRPALADLELTLADGSRKHLQCLIPEVQPISAQAAPAP